MGVDEYDPDCSDTSSESDFNGDGLVNYEEFEYFSLAWLSHDPNDPAIIDPNDPTYDPDLSDPNSASYIHPNAFASWDVRCDLDSDYTVDIYDLAIFLDDWLWMACWRSTSGAPEMLVMFGGEEMASVESMMAIPMSMSFSAEVIIVEQDPYVNLTDKELTEQAETLIEMLDFLIEVALDEDVDPESVDAITEDIAEMLDDMRDERYQRDEKD